MNNADLGVIIKLQHDSFCELNLFDQFSFWMRILYKIDMIGISKWVDNLSLKGRNYQNLFLSYAIKMIRECMIFNFANKSLLKINKKEYDFISKFADFIHEENTIIIVDNLEESIKAINRNANAKILFFELSLQMLKLLKLKRNFVIK